MSNTIDQRVVEMRFDNKQFESGVSTTLSTLDKLKQKLNLTGASKGLDSINASAKKVDMSGLGGAVESVSAKFSALQVMGVTALANITNSAVNAGKNIVKSLTVDPIMSGFEEYETKMGSIQTILANTEHQGTNLDQVTAALDKLNLYADKTIYNFQQMTRNIGTFTAAGVDLDTSVKSIQGIANLAAVSGSTSQQASTAMYQLSQALASGTVKLMDWNSVVNAGMGGKVFQNALIRTAAVMAGASEDVAAWQKENIDAHGSFRDSLTQGAWLTTDVLTKTLEQFTMAAEEGSDEWEAFKKSLTAEGYTEKQAEEILKMANTATDAATKVKTFTQLMDTLKESAQSGWAQTWELLIGDFEEAKEFFTNLSDIFGKIIGESADRRNSLFGDALKSNWEKITDQLMDAGVEMSAFEDNIKKIVGETKFDKIVEEFGSIEKAAKAGKITTDDLKKAISNLGKDSKVTSAFDFAGMADKVKGNKFTYSLGGLGKVSDEVKQIQTALSQLGYEVSPDGKFGKATYQAVMQFQKAAGIKIDGIVGEETIAALEEAVGKTETLNGEVDDLNKSCDDLIDGITKKGGRELLLDSLLNIVKAIQRPLQAVGEAFRTTFAVSGEQIYNVLEKIESFTSKLVMKGVLDETTWVGLREAVKALGIEWSDFKEALKSTLEDHGVNVDELLDKYGNLANAFNDGAISMDIVKETLLGFDGVSESLLKGGKAADKLMRAFKGLFSILRIFTTFAGGAFSIAFRVLETVLDKFDIGILDFAANVGDAMVKVSDYINGIIDSGIGALIDWLIPKLESASETISKWVASFKEINVVKSIINGLKNIPSVIDTITSAFDKAIEIIGSLIDSFKESEIFQTVSGWISDAADTIQTSLSGISTAVDNFNLSTVGQKLKEFGSWISGLASTVSKTKTFTTVVDAVTAAFVKLDEILGNFKFDPSLSGIKNFANWGRKLDSKSSFKGIQSFVKGFSGVTLDNFKFKWDTAKTNALQKFTEFWVASGEKVMQAFEKGKAAAKALKEFVFGTEQVDLPKILGVVEKFLAISVLYQALKTIQSLTSPFDGIADGLNNLAKGVKWRAIGDALKAMAIAFGVLTACIVILAGMDDMNKAITAAKILGQLLITMGIVIVGLSFVVSKMQGVNAISAIGSVLAIVIALVLLVKVIEKLDTSRLKDPIGTFTELFAMLMVLALGVKIVSKASNASFGSIAAILTMITALSQILDVIKKYDEYPWEGMEDAIKRMIQMLIVLGVAIRVASGGLKAGASATGLAFTLIAMMLSLYMLLDIIKKFGEAVNDSSFEAGKNAVLQLLSFMTLMSFVLGKVGRTTISKDQKVINNFAGMALALLVVVGAIYVLGKMALEHKDVLINGGNAVGQILLMFTVMLGTIGLACRGLKLGGVVAMMIGIGLIIAELYYIIKDMQSIPWESAISSAASLTIVLVAMATVFSKLGKIPTSFKQAFLLSGMLIILDGIVIGLGWLLDCMKDIPWQSALGSAAGLSALLGAMTGVMYAVSGLETSKLSKAKMKRVSDAMLRLSVVLAALGAVLWLMSRFGGTQNATKNAIGLSILLVAMTGVLQVIGSLDTKDYSDAKLKKVAAAMLTLSLVLGALAVVLAIMSKLGTTNAIGNATALAGLLIAMAYVMQILGDSKTMNWRKMGTVLISMATLTLILYAIAGVLTIMNGLNVGKSIGNVIALSAMLLAMSYALDIISKSKSMNWAKMGTVLISMATLTIILGFVAQIIAKLNGINPAQAIGNAVALGGLLLAMATALQIISGSKVMSGGQTAGVLVSMAVLTVVLGFVAQIIAKLDGINPLKAIGNAIALGALLNAMAAALLILSFVKSVSAGALVGMAGLAGVIYLLVPAMEKLNSMVIPIQTAISLGILLNAMAAALVILQFVQVVSVPAMVGMAAMTLIIAGLAWVLAEVSKIRCDAAMTVVQALCLLLGTMTAAFVILGVTGSLAPTAIAGAVGLVAVVAILGVAAAAIGGVMSLIPAETITKWKTGLEQFMEFIAILAEGLGKIASGFVVGFTDGLAEAGENLKSFASSLAGVDTNAVTGAQALADAVLALTGASFLDGLTNWLFGEDSLSTFGDKVATLATAITESATALANITDADATNIKRGAEAAKPLAELANAVPKSVGLWQDIAGESDLESFGKKIVAFAGCLVEYSAAVAGKTIDSKAIQKSAEAGKHLADLNASIPASGGVWQQIAGEADLASWGAKIVSFATALVDYSNILAGGTINVDAIKNSATAAGHIAELNSALTADNGVWQKLAGSKDLGTFGDSLSAFGNGLLEYSNVAAQIDDSKIEAINRTKEAFAAIKGVMAEIPDEGGWFSKLFKSSESGDATSFGGALISMATGLDSFCTTAANIDDSDLTAITYLETIIGKINTVLEAVPDAATCLKANDLNTAMTNFSSIGTTLNSITMGEYDYSGLDSLKTSVASFVDVLTDVDASDVNSKFGELYSAINNAATIASTLAGLNSYTYTGVDTLKAALESLGGANVQSVIDAFAGKAEAMRTAVSSLVTALSNGLSDGDHTVDSSAKDLANGAATAVLETSDKFKASGRLLGDALADGLEEKSDTVEKSGKTVAGFAATGASDGYQGMYDAGASLAGGLAAGIRDNAAAVAAEAAQMVRDAIDAAEAEADINSPSKEFMRIGASFIEGTVKGIGDNARDVVSSSKSMVHSAIKATSNVVSRVADAINSDIDAQPTIRPVLDLSDVRSGAGAISSLLDSNPALMSNLGAINTMMNRRSQNGANNEVVSAITKLRRDIANMPRESYNINGVTYDDGSNIKNFAEAVVHQARLERRV